MEQKAILVGIENVSFTNDKGEDVKFTRLYLVDPPDMTELSANFAGRRSATLNTQRSDPDWKNYLDQEVILIYRCNLGSKNPRLVDMKLA